uniref:Mytilin 8 n=1 Tax=Perna canaliculus TaxID=38949 RepID=A0A6B9XR41_PERCI|nr:mytilin 8 [Perna canaliculus]
MKTAVLLLLVLVAYIMIQDTEAGCGGCKYKCRRRGCRGYVCYKKRWLTICKCFRCSGDTYLAKGNNGLVEQPTVDEMMEMPIDEDDRHN